MPGPPPIADLGLPPGEVNLGYVIRDQAGLKALFDSIVADVRAAKWEGWLQGELRLIEKLHDDYFQTRGRTFYTAAGGWAPNKQSTVKAKGHARVLFGKPKDGFRLHKSLSQPQSEFGIRITVDNWPDRATLVFGTDAPYHKYNQYGTRRIPARPHLGLTPQFFDKTVERAVDHVFRAIQES